MVLVVFNLIILVAYNMHLKNTKVKEEKSEGYGYKFKIQDIRYTIGRIIVSGSNNYNDPWKIDHIPHELAALFNPETLKKFSTLLEKEASWNRGVRIFCFIFSYVNLSPGFLFLQRVLRINRVNRSMKVINNQANFDGVGLFKKDKNYQLKWTVTSDKSKLFLDIVDKEENQRNLLNWELPFPQRFIIFGNGTYNQPFKMEFRDPSLIKIIDHLKDIIDNHPHYYEIFKFPEYLLKYSKSSNQTGHFIEYYFCWLNVNLKTLSRVEPLGKFMAKWEFICKSILEPANNEILLPNGYQFKLRFENTRQSSKRTNKYQSLTVPFADSDQVKKFGNFFYSMHNAKKQENIVYELYFYVEKLKIGGHKYDKSEDFTAAGTGNSELKKEQVKERRTELIQLENIKNNMKKTVIEKQREHDNHKLDFEELELLYLPNKNRETFFPLEFSNYLFWLIYRHHAPMRTLNFLVVAIMISLIIEIVVISI